MLHYLSFQPLGRRRLIGLTLLCLAALLLAGCSSLTDQHGVDFTITVEAEDCKRLDVKAERDEQKLKDSSEQGTGVKVRR